MRRDTMQTIETKMREAAAKLSGRQERRLHYRLADGSRPHTARLASCAAKRSAETGLEPVLHRQSGDVLAQAVRKPPRPREDYRPRACGIVAKGCDAPRFSDLSKRNRCPARTSSSSHALRGYEGRTPEGRGRRRDHARLCRMCQPTVPGAISRSRARAENRQKPRTIG